MVDNLLIVVHRLFIRMLTPLLIDEILLPRYMNWSTNFRGLSFNEKKALPSLKHVISVLSEFVRRPLLLVTCFKLAAEIQLELVHLQAEDHSYSQHQ